STKRIKQILAPQSKSENGSVGWDADSEFVEFNNDSDDSDGEDDTSAAAMDSDTKTENDVPSSSSSSSLTGKRSTGGTTKQSFDEFVREQTKKFNAETRERPHDIDLWLRFVDFQDESVASHRKNISAPILEKKLAILSKALSLNPRSEELTIARLTVGARHWA